MTFDYQGIGTSRFVYAQLVDNSTGRVLGNLVTPIPVTLDGKTHTVTIPAGELGNLADVAYTALAGGGNLTLQITSSATAYENFTAYGVVKISSVDVSLPTVA